MVSLNPLRILKMQAEEEKGEMARMSNFVGAIAIGDLVKSTLGPKGMDKMLVSGGRTNGHVEITNDGATILKSLGVDNPAAKILVNMARAQDDEVGDGTTSVTVLAAELLREAEKLIEKKIHPQTIIAGYRLASRVALKSLEQAALDHSQNEELFKQDLMKLARTALSSKILSLHKELFSKLAVNATMRLKGSGNINAVQIIKKVGGTLNDSYLDDGFLLDKKIGQFQPKVVKDARILIANTPMDTDRIKVFGSRVRVESMAKVAELEVAEKEKMKDKVEKIIAHKCNVFINRQLIYNYPEQLFADHGIMAIEHADFDGIERLALVTGGDIVSTFDEPEATKLGHCDLIEEIMIGEDKLLKFSGVPRGEACSVVIRGATKQIVDEAERSFHDALCVLSTFSKDSKVLPGGGCPEMIIYKAVIEEAGRVAGKEALAMESFAKAFLVIPITLSDNGGFDSAFLISTLRAAHMSGNSTYGLNLERGDVACMQLLGVTESYLVKRQMVLAALEATETILRVDDIIKAAPRERKEDRGMC